MVRHTLSKMLSISALVLMSLGFASSSSATTAATADRTTVLETKMVLRDLWVEHVFWIRSYVLATHTHDTAQSKVAEQEVVANARALAGTITPFYGQAASDNLFKLLAGHWGAVHDYNTATVAKSKADQDKAVANINRNAHEIARFLSSANPNLPEEAVFGLLASHGGHHVAQINHIAAGDFQDEAATWHAMRKHMLAISDAITDALAKQSPEHFQSRL